MTAKHDVYDFCSRYFAPKVGIPEDPVVGPHIADLGITGERNLIKVSYQQFNAQNYI